jgi:hypothetical protein
MYCDKPHFLTKYKCDENEKSIERKGMELGEKGRNSEGKERE